MANATPRQEGVGDDASFDSPNRYSYQGEVISGANYRALDEQQDLACNQTQEMLNCEDSLADLKGLQPVPEGVSGKVKARRGGSCAFGYDDLYVYKQDDFGGDVAVLHFTGDWYNLGNGLNNETSSFITGNKTAHLSEEADGVGNWFPEDTSQCVFRANLFGTGWNNRISSRKRQVGT
jgi:hypothetical protein